MTLFSPSRAEHSGGRRAAAMAIVLIAALVIVAATVLFSGMAAHASEAVSGHSTSRGVSLLSTLFYGALAGLLLGAGTILVVVAPLRTHRMKSVDRTR